MTLVAAWVETSTWASSPRAATAPERSGSQVTAALTRLALYMAAAAGASWLKMMFFSMVLRSSEERPDWLRRYSSRKWEGVNWVQAMVLPLRSSMDLMLTSET